MVKVLASCFWTAFVINRGKCCPFFDRAFCIRSMLKIFGESSRARICRGEFLGKNCMKVLASCFWAVFVIKQGEMLPVFLTELFASIRC